MIRPSIALLLSIFLVVGCANTASERTSKDWRAVSFVQLQSEVTKKSKHAWFYNGSDETFHYFTRMPMTMLTGSYSYFRIKKSEYPWIGQHEERSFGKEGLIYGVKGRAFESGSGKLGNHDFKRGITLLYD
jgi:hypothetical protein